ncbi:hypothetical protein AGLY_011555 [Aphis glycines]|uniref:Uncharacterized protein n=1 Tax=Aphis glycines TaxID=307491 RepID=A0A6G0TCG3_APHGL|nr:hypothetical protein AGLY_011555 [Aphis glycines]
MACKNFGTNNKKVEMTPLSDQHRRRGCPNETTGTSIETNAPRQSANYVGLTAIKHFTKTITLNGTSVNGIVDTGSTSVLVRDSVARKAGIAYRRMICPLYSLGDDNHPSTSTIGEAKVDVIIDGVLAADYQVRIVGDDTIPVDVLVRQTWLILPHVHYYKRGAEMVFESNTAIETERLVPEKGLKSWKVLREEQSDQEDEGEDSEGQTDTSGDEEAIRNDGNLDPGDTTNDTGRAKRTRGLPGYLQDYVLE